MQELGLPPMPVEKPPERDVLARAPSPIPPLPVESPSSPLRRRSRDVTGRTGLMVGRLPLGTEDAEVKDLMRRIMGGRSGTSIQQSTEDEIEAALAFAVAATMGNEDAEEPTAESTIEFDHVETHDSWRSSYALVYFAGAFVRPNLRHARPVTPLLPPFPTRCGQRNPACPTVTPSRRWTGWRSPYQALSSNFFAAS